LARNFFTDFLKSISASHLEIFFIFHASDPYYFAFFSALFVLICKAMIISICAAFDLEFSNILLQADSLVAIMSEMLTHEHLLFSNVYQL